MTKPPATQGKYVSLEILRLVGIMMVVIEHYATTCTSFGLGAPMFRTPGPIFLSFFFCFSGFIIYTIHHRDKGNPRLILRYVWRRLWRILPVYWLSLILMIVVLWHGISWAYLFNNLTATPTTGSSFAELNPPAWTLRNEMLYYFVFAGALFIPAIGRFVFPLWGALLAVSWYRDWQHEAPLTHFLPPALQGLGFHAFMLLDIFILAGVASAWAFARYQPGPRWLWSMLALCAAALLPLIWADDWGRLYAADIRLPFVAFIVATLIFTLSALERGGHLRLHRRWEICGVIAYPLYLLHSDASFAFATYYFYHPELKHTFTAPELFTLMLAIAFLISWGAAFWFDVPIQRFARRFFSGPHRAKAPDSSASKPA